LLIEIISIDSASATVSPSLFYFDSTTALTKNFIVTTLEDGDYKDGTITFKASVQEGSETFNAKQGLFALAVIENFAYNVDIDGNGIIEESVDFKLMKRYKLGLRATSNGSTLLNNIIRFGSGRSPQEIDDYLSLGVVNTPLYLDIDGNGLIQEGIDFKVIKRYKLGLRAITNGGTLFDKLVLPSTRTRDDQKINDYLEYLFKVN
jgi:hypothetical protein